MKLKQLINIGIRKLLDLLGFKSMRLCGEDEQTDSPKATGKTTRREEDPIACMYGVPSARYIFKGNVTDAEGLPIANAQLLFSVHGQPMAEVETGSDGSFSFDETDEPCDFTITASADRYMQAKTPSSPLNK